MKFLPSALLRGGQGGGGDLAGDDRSQHPLRAPSARASDDLGVPLWEEDFKGVGRCAQAWRPWEKSALEGSESGVSV